MTVLLQDEQEIKEAMANDAVTALTHYAPANKASFRDEDEDERILESAHRQAPWIRDVIDAAEELLKSRDC